MKLPHIQIILALLMTGGLGALAQSGNTVPGPTDYGAFTRFITDRNIFAPNRQPHDFSEQKVARPRTHAAGAPAFTLVGTMGYEKGLFAFFNGNSPDLRKALPVSESIAGYNVADISYGHVTLESTNKSQKLELNVGDVVREENGAWQLAGQGDLAAASGVSGPDAGASADKSSGGDGSGTPASASAPNDILKRLMEKREQENK